MHRDTELHKEKAALHSFLSEQQKCVSHENCETHFLIFIESFLFLTEITHYKRQLSQGKDYSWQQYLNELDQDRTLWNEVLMGYRNALAWLNFKPAWEARRLAELIKAVTEARDDHG